MKIEPWESICIGFFHLRFFPPTKLQPLNVDVTKQGVPHAQWEQG